MSKKSKRPEPLKPYIRKGGIVVMRVPMGTPIAERVKATNWAHNVARRISK